jgi:hypothetical protein
MNAFNVIMGVVTFLVAIPLCSEFEWQLHSKVMHKPVSIWGFKLDIFFKAHAVVHHQIFGYDHTYHLQRDEDKYTITMAWYHGFALAVISSIPFWIVGALIGWAVMSLDTTLIIGLTSFLTVYAYYGVYEASHWCMHLPRPTKRRLIELCLPFKWLNGHHILHHRYMGKNFNVVLPLADWYHGTILLRSKIRFNQPKGPLVPDLQPLVTNPASKEELSLVE